MCHVYRVVYIFGGAVKFPIEDITPTFLTKGVLSTLRQADHVATTILHEAGVSGNISQMPVILLPLHFDRDPSTHVPSCQRSVAIRTFITNDFMTGVPAEPGKDIPVQVSSLTLTHTRIHMHARTHHAHTHTHTRMHAYQTDLPLWFFFCQQQPCTLNFT